MLTNPIKVFWFVILLISSLILTGCRDHDDLPPKRLYTISGTVVGASAGVTVSIQGPQNRSVLTDVSGKYDAKDLPPGRYTVSPVLEGFVFEPATAQVDLGDRDVAVPAFTRQPPSEGLSPEEAARIDAIPESQTPAKDIILPNGRTLEEYLRSRQLPLPALTSSTGSAALALPVTPPIGPQQRKNDIVAMMVSTAQDFACARRSNLPCTKWDYAADAAAPETRPAQTGLTYVYGGRDITVRTRPIDGCLQETYGTDCSGLVIQAAKAADVTAPTSSVTQGVAENWTFPPEWQLQMKQVTDGSIQTGDIVWWNGHTGLAIGSTSFVSSTGSPGQCQRNIRPPRGPRELSYTSFGRGMPTKVLRLTTTLSGTWDMYIRCTNEITDAAIIRFNIDNNAGGAFTASGSGVDYGGAPLSFILSGDYDQIANRVDATLAFTDGTRSDQFSQTLLEDDTGYFPLTKVIDNGGCAGSARLVRVSATSPLRTPSAPPSGNRPRAQTWSGR